MFPVLQCTGTQECASYRGVEQLVARRAHNPEVVGSSPASATRKEKVIPIGMAFFFYPACVASFGSTSGFPEGSEGSAAGGRYSDPSEWQRSARDEGIRAEDIRRAPQQDVIAVN